MFDGFRKFCTGVLCEPTGQPSFSRTITTVAVSFVLGWLTAILTVFIWTLHHYKVITNVADLSTAMTGFGSSYSSLLTSAAAFIGALATTTYGLNKVATMFGNNPPKDIRQ